MITTNNNEITKEEILAVFPKVAATMADALACNAGVTLPKNEALPTEIL